MHFSSCAHCGAQNDANAKFCSQCGKHISQPRQPSEGVASIFKGAKQAFIFSCVLIVIFLVARGHVGGTSPATSETAKAADPCADDPLKCAYERGRIDAEVLCPAEIEKLARFAVKWTDGTFDSKFDHYRWNDQSKGQVTFIGNKVEFQNEFGAFAPMIYSCELSQDGKTVLKVAVREGRL